MKKLMIGLVAASATIFAFGALPSGTSFEAYETGEKTIEDLTAHEDNGVGTGDNRYWFYEGEKIGVAIGVITNGTPNAPSRPAQFADDTNLQYLDLTASDATNVLYRAVNSVAGKSAVAYLDGQSIDNGLYLDTLVKFTPGELTSLELGDGDKIALTYVEETDDEDNDGKVLSNIVVRAGYVNGSTVTPTNYIMDAIPGFSAADWHRLTVRAINVGYADAPVGFVVYVDGVEVTYDLAQEPGDSAYLAALAGNSIVANYLYNTEKHAFIPSAVNTGTAKTTLSAVGFKGNGCVDDISFTATPPTFIVEGTAVTIAWDANVETYTVVAGEDTLINAEAVSGAGSTNLLLDTSVATLTVTATYATGYEAGTWTVTGSGAAISGSTFTVAPGAQLNIVSMEPLFQVGETHYGTFAEALAAAVAASKATDPWTSVTIKALADIDEGISFTDGDIVLDLNGKTLQGTVEEFTINNSGAVLTIIDSASGGTVIAPSGEASRGALYMDDGATVINGGRFEGYVITQKMDEDVGADDLTLNGGVFFDDLYNPEGVDPKFYLYDYLGTGVEATYNAGYFTVGTPAPEPTTYELTIPTVTGASATVTDKATSSVIADITAIEDGTVVTVTWTPDSGYKITAGDSEEITMDDNKTAKSPTVVAITYATLTITPVENCTIVVSNATEEVATGATFDVDDAVELTVYRTPAEGYELDNCAATETITMDQDRTVTAAVKQSGGDYPSYIPTEDAEAKAKYDAWATYAGVTPAAAAELEDAFLLNCLPAEVEEAKAAFKVNSITYNTELGEWVVTTEEAFKGRTYNGTVTVKRYSDVGCKTESSTGTFFKAVLQ